MSSNEPVKNGCEVIYENFSYIELPICNQVSYDHRSYVTAMINTQCQGLHRLVG